MLGSGKSRLSTAITVAVRSSIKASIQWLRRVLHDIDEKLRQTIRSSPVGREKDDLLLSIPGVGERTSFTLLAHVPDLDSLNRKQIAALVEVAEGTTASAVTV